MGEKGDGDWIDEVRSAVSYLSHCIHRYSFARMYSKNVQYISTSILGT